MHLPDFTLPITDPVLIFALVMVLILVLPLLFQRIRVPGIVGLIIAGVLVGPHALGVLARDQTIQLLGTVGILYIMFIAGLEVDLNEFNRQRNRSIVFGAVTFAVPQGVGTLMGRFVLGFDWPGSVLLGAVFASHTLLAYPIVSRLGLSKGEAVTTAVGATILTDTAALLVLAVIVNAADGALTAGFWLQMTVVLGVYVTGVMWGVPRLGRWFFQKVRSDGETEFVFVLAVVFVCAFLAAMAGVEPIIGAFLAGLALNRLVPEHSTLMSRTRFVGDSLFIPFFLLSVGMLVDLNVLVGGAEAWVVAGVMLGTVTITKWLAAQSTRPLFGYSADQAWMLFGLTIPQAAATLATVLIGYNVGIFGDSVLNGTILMMLATCMIGPWYAERYGRRVALHAERAPFEPSRAPQRILVPLANPETAPTLMDVAFMIRKPASEQPIYPLAIVRSEDDVQAGVAAGEKLLGHAVVHAAAADVPATPIVRIDRNVAHGILRAVREQMASTVVIGWNGKSSGRNFTFGSILDQLLEESHELVLVSKVEQPLGTVERLVVAVPPYAHLEPGFADALQHVKVLASQMGAALLVVVPEEHRAAVAARLGKLKPAVPVTYRPLSEWARLVPVLESEGKAHDLFVIVAARQGTISWRPALGRLPRQLASHFPATSLIVCYPPVPRNEGQPALTLPSGELVLSGLISTDHIVIDVDGADADAVLDQILRSALHGRPDALRETRDAVLPMEADSVPELMPGVVLYHAHVGAVQEPHLFVGVSRAGLRFAHGNHRVHVLLLLLSPETGSAEEHLQHLALVARLVRSGEMVEQLRAATSPEQVREILAGGILAGGILAGGVLAPQFGWQKRAQVRPGRAAGELPGGAFYDHIAVFAGERSALVPLLAEALQRTILMGRRLSLVCAGAPSEAREAQVAEALARVGLSAETPRIWLERVVPEALPAAVATHAIDLLLVESFEDQRRLDVHLSPVAEVLAREAPTSLLLLHQTRLQPEPYRRIVFVAEYEQPSVLALQKTFRLAERERAGQVFVIRVVPRFGEARILAGGGEAGSLLAPPLEQEQTLLDDLVHAGGETTVPVQTFVLEGHTGFTATQFARRYRADLLVLPRGEWDAELLDRLHPSEMGWGLREVACDVWVAREHA